MVGLSKEVIVISGCSGRTGTRVAHKFADPRFLVVGLDVLAPKISTTNFEFIACDITSEAQVAAAMQHIRKKYPEQIASIVHLASQFDKNQQNLQLYDEVVVQGAKHLMQAALSFKTEQFIFASSMHVFMPCEPGQKINEHWPVGPLWDFPRSQAKAEELLKSQHAHIPLVILRKGSTYDSLCHIMPLAHQIQRIYERSSTSFFFPGNLAHGAPCVHLDDVADAIWLAVQRRFGIPKETTMIVAEPETVSYGELQKVIGLLCYGEECKTWTIPKWVAKFAIRACDKIPFLPKTDIKEWMVDQADYNYSCDISLIQDKLGWAPKHTFRQTLPKMIAALKENELAWYRENNLTRSV